MELKLAQAIFILVHGLNGREVELNARQISHFAQPKESGVLIKSGCVIYMTNGKFISVRESCNEILERIGGH